MHLITDLVVPELNRLELFHYLLLSNIKQVLQTKMMAKDIKIHHR